MRNIHRSVGIWQRTNSPNQQRRLLFRNSGPNLVIKIYQHFIRRIPKFGRWRPGVAPSNFKGPVLQCDRRPLLVKKKLTSDRVRTILFPSAVFTLNAGPDRIKLIHGRFNQSGVICQYSGLKVAGLGAFHTYSGAGQVC